MLPVPEANRSALWVRQPNKSHEVRVPDYTTQLHERKRTTFRLAGLRGLSRVPLADQPPFQNDALPLLITACSVDRWKR